MSCGGGGNKKLRNLKFIICIIHHILLEYQIEEYEMVGAKNMHRKYDKCMHNLIQKTRREETICKTHV